jgi:hypothetical protein
MFSSAASQSMSSGPADFDFEGGTLFLSPLYATIGADGKVVV